MKNHYDFQQEQKYNQSQKVGGFDLLKILPLLIKNWYWIILAILIAFFCARFYISHTLPVYQVSSTILINQANENTALNDQFLQGLGLPPGVQNINNQIMVLSSIQLTERALDELPFDIDIYFRTLRNKLPVYPEIPISISLITGNDLPREVEFEITFLGDNSYSLAARSDARYEMTTQSLFGDTIAFPGGSFRIDSKNYDFLTKNINKAFCFTIHDKLSLVRNYNSRLKVEAISREGTIIRLSLDGTNRKKDVDFINTLTDIFISLSLDKKNLEAIRRIQFIDDQLVGISDSLSLTENKLQQFRSSHRVMDLSTQGQAIIGQVTLLENERARLSLEASYYDYLADYLAKNESDELPIIPITMGINDPGLTRLVEELTELQGQLSTRGAGEMNPLQRNLEQRIRTTKDAVRETLNGLRRANSLARSENQEQINKANIQASSLPVTERQLIGIERQFTLNNELYTFLLERRAELQMQKASNIADNEVIDYAQEFSAVLISPNSPRIYVLSWFIGLVIPILLIFIADLLNKTIKEEDLANITNLPLAGNIPHNPYKTDAVVFNYPESSITELFRVLRSRMQFFTKEIKSPVIIVTSSLSEDGKTFIAINLASVYSLMGRKTVLVGFDLRKPKIHQSFNLSNEKGISTWLIGEDELQDIIKPTKYENLSIIPSGPIPPNPAELTALPKTKDLIDILKSKYDCIIIDSSPIGLVSDTYHLTSLVDSSLFVVRVKKTLREIVLGTLNEMKMSGVRNISMVLNDLDVNRKRYGYGGENSYTKDKKKKVISSILARK